MRNLWDSPSKKWRPVIERRIENSCLSTEKFLSDEKLAYVKLLGNMYILTMKQLEIFKFYFLYSETRGIIHADWSERFKIGWEVYLHLKSMGADVHHCRLSIIKILNPR